MKALIIKIYLPSAYSQTFLLKQNFNHTMTKNYVEIFKVFYNEYVASTIRKSYITEILVSVSPG